MEAVHTQFLNIKAAISYSESSFKVQVGDYTQRSMDIGPLVFFLTVLTCCFCQENAPQTFPAVVHEVCPSAEEHAAITEKITEQVLSLLNISSQPPCACGGPEWTKVAHLDMSDPSQQCPSNWNLVTTPVRGCRQSGGFGCNSVSFASNGKLYSRVCGRVIAYQQGVPNAFLRSISANPGLEGVYVDGVSLTHGAEGSRQHIWTFAAAAAYETEADAVSSKSRCPCTNTDNSWPHTLPEFVGDNYFCDTGNPGPEFDFGTVYTDDPLWDGEGCGPTSTCCEFNNPPWFCITLSQPTTDDIEVRICLDDFGEEVIVSLVDIYVM